MFISMYIYVYISQNVAFQCLPLRAIHVHISGCWLGSPKVWISWTSSISGSSASQNHQPQVKQFKSNSYYHQVRPARPIKKTSKNMMFHHFPPIFFLLTLDFAELKLRLPHRPCASLPWLA